MKMLLQLFALIIFLFLGFNINSYSQCGTNTMQGGASGCVRSTNYSGEIPPYSGTTYVAQSPYSPGTYFRIPVLQGACYTISTCGAGFDTQINCFQNPASTGPFAYNDDLGPECAGLQASLIMTPAFTDYALIDVRQYNCLPAGPSSITVYVRQNNNLSITSSGADMCEGQVRSLTATPAAVATAQPNSGNLGTFTGSGVAGTTFTAPTPATSSQTFTITYTFGYVSTTQNILVYHAPTASNAGSNFTAPCNSTSATLSGNTPTFGTGAWSVVSGPGTVTTPSDPNSGVTGLTLGTPTTFRWTISNGTCTSSFSDVTITVPPNPTPAASNGGPYCEGGTIQLISVSGSGTDDWSGPNSFGVNDIQNPTIPSATILAGGVYTVTATNLYGCSATATTSVIVNPLPTPTATNTGPYCVGASIQLNSPTGSSSDDWIGPNSYTANDIQNPSIPSSIVLMSGVYTVTVTNVSNCSATATTTVLVSSYPTPSATNTGPYCAGQPIQLNSVSGSVTDDWIGPLAYSQNDMQNPLILSSTVAMSGVYTVTATNATCSATATTTVVVNPIPTPTATNTGPYCEGETIQLNSPSGFATDDWTGPASFTATDTQNPSIASSVVAMSGTYTVTVTDVTSCSATATTTVIVNLNPTVLFNCTTDSICTNGSAVNLNGMLPSGGTFVGTGVSGTTFDPSSLALGFYVIDYNFTDANSCSGTDSDSILVTACLSISDIDNSDLNLFPNPTTGKFYLSIENDLTGEMHIYIVDLNGKMIYTSTTQKSNENFVKEIDISEEAPGVYFLNVVFDGGKRITKQIIKH